MKINTWLLIFYFLVTSCGTTGHIALYNFETNKKNVEDKLIAISKSSPSFEVPQNWKEHTKGDYFQRIYIYFKESPEEIYQLGFMGDSASWSRSSTCKLGLISIYQGDQFKYEENLSSKEKARIELRFEKEFLSKVNLAFYKTE